MRRAGSSRIPNTLTGALGRSRRYLSSPHAGLGLNATSSPSPRATLMIVLKFG